MSSHFRLSCVVSFRPPGCTLAPSNTNVSVDAGSCVSSLCAHTSYADRSSKLGAHNVFDIPEVCWACRYYLELSDFHRPLRTRTHLLRPHTRAQPCRLLIDSCHQISRLASLFEPQAATVHLALDVTPLVARISWPGTSMCACCNADEEPLAEHVRGGESRGM